MSSVLLLKISSLGAKSARADSVQSVIVTYLLSSFSGELENTNISKTISLFQLEYTGWGYDRT